MESEVYFVRYAFPCSHIIHKVRREINDEQYNMLKEAAIHEKTLDRKILEGIFFRAFERINRVTKEMNKEEWDVDVIREYFQNRHNKILDESDYPDSFKEQCKVYQGEIIKLIDDTHVIVAYNNDKNEAKKRNVSSEYFSDVEVGEKVFIHWGYAVEKVSTSERK